jgi:hypothetical protein
LSQIFRCQRLQVIETAQMQRDVSEGSVAIHKRRPMGEILAAIFHRLPVMMTLFYRRRRFPLLTTRTVLIMACALAGSRLAEAQSAQITKLSLPLPPFVSRADLYVASTCDTPRAVLVLCPGMNGDGGKWIDKPEWQTFARQHQLGLVGLAFESDPNDHTHGYHYVRQGSGQILIDGIRKIYGKDMPLLMYGFSRGAVFACRFADWQPKRLLAWCAYSPGEGDDQSAHPDAPPGLIACGENDSNYGWAMFYFKKGRALGKPWLWLSLANIGHTRSAASEDFARRYLAAALQGNRQPIWVDVDGKEEIAARQAQEVPALSGILPDSGLLANWKAIHDP